jgi:predicted RNA binding protein with dsRBD fold (UPF0201 family)
MTRQKTYGLLVLVLVITLNGAFPARLIGKWSAIAKASSEQNRQLQQELVGEAKMQRNTPIRLIGSLTRDRYWTSVLPLTEEQQKVIMALNHLVNEGRYQTRLADAAAVTADPTRREQLLLQSWDRQLEAIRHAIRLVSLGLLTEEQAAFVLQRDVALNGLSALYADKNLVELIGLRADQRLKLDEAKAEATANANKLMTLAFQTDPQSVKEYKIAIDDQKRVNDAAVRRIFTPDQMEKWNQLTAKRSLPAKPPNATRSALSGAEVAGVHILDLSPIFHDLAAHANVVGLSADQKTLLKDLEDVTREGYVWIGRRDLEGSPGHEDAGKSRDDGISRIRSEFVKHAEQVALLGILSERQAEKLQVVMREN